MVVDTPRVVKIMKTSHSKLKQCLKSFRVHVSLSSIVSVCVYKTVFADNYSLDDPLESRRYFELLTELLFQVFDELPWNGFFELGDVWSILIV